MSTQVTSMAVVSSTVDSTPIGSTTPSTARFITPSSTDNSQNAATTAWCLLGFAISLGTSGYVKFPSWLGGLILQWVVGPYTATDPIAPVSVSFPLTFPTACLFVIPGTLNPSPTDTNMSYWQLISFTASAASLWFMRNADHAYDGITPLLVAIGY